MAITRIKNSSIANRTPKYNDFLAGLPFRPVIGTATDGGTGTTVSVAFTGNNPAGAGITYTALSSPGSITATGPASPITVTGLTSGTAYTFQVKAGNSLGDSAYSAASNSVAPVQPTAFESIASASGSGSSSVSFNSIPGTYQHLQLRFSLRVNNNGRDVYISFNSDTGSNYATHWLYGDGTSASAGQRNSNTPAYNLGAISTGGAYSDYQFVGIIDIHDYASTSKTKTFRTFSGIDRNGSGEAGVYSGLWNSTSAITSITITCASTTFTGSSFALYGIKGA